MTRMFRLSMFGILAGREPCPKFDFFFATVFWTLGLAPVWACDPNESCNRCLVSAFNHCIQSGNDPVCEARKAACHTYAPLVDTPGSPFGPGSPGGQGGIVTQNEIQSCVSNIQACPSILFSRLTYQVLAPITNQYIAFLSAQGAGKFQSFPADLINKIQPYYAVDLSTLVYATNINTIHGSNITVGNAIYFVRGMDFNNDDDLRLVFHEMEHAVQYAARGGGSPSAGVPSFLAEYIPKAAGKVIENHSFRIHDFIDLESAAINKASIVSNAVIGVKLGFENQCSHPVQMAVSYLDLQGQWHTDGYWDLASGADTYLSNGDGQPLRTRNAIIYFYGKSSDGSNITWRGDAPLTIAADSKSENFIMKNHGNQTTGDMTEAFACAGQ
jgi:hypothetical protein